MVKEIFHLLETYVYIYQYNKKSNYVFMYILLLFIIYYYIILLTCSL